nr:unnamed protein product [Callosobruchus analis]
MMTSTYPVWAVNRTLFYCNLKSLMEKFKFVANRVFNVDETGITTVQKKCPKVYGPKGAKKVGPLFPETGEGP